MRLLRALQCRLFGHPATVLVWGPVVNRSFVGRVRHQPTRMVNEVCVRCGFVLHTTTLRQEGERWIA